MFDFQCTNCRHPYHADESHVGKAIRCVQCGAVVAITKSRSGADLHIADGRDLNKPRPLRTRLSKQSRIFNRTRSLILAAVSVIGLIVFSVILPLWHETPQQKKAASSVQPAGM